jgi:phage terminase large subunit
MTTLTAFDQLAEELAGYADDPIGFAEDILNLKLDTWQCRFLEAVREYQRVAVRSSTGQGKDFIAAAADLWFFVSYDKAYCPCSANTESQLEKILWKQFAELIENSNGLDAIAQWTATTIRHRKFPAEWLIFAKTSGKKITSGGEQHAEASSGHHADNMLILLDEASGIEEVFWQAYEPTLTGPNNKLVAIGNPNRLSGSFHSIWYKSVVSGFWKRFTIAGKDNTKARASLIAGDEFCVSGRGNQSGNHDYLLAKWGVNHPIVQSKVFGVHPTASIERAGYAYEEVRAAQTRQIEPSKFDGVQIGIDVSGGGRDRTVYMIRRGSRFRMIVERPQSIHHIVDKAMEIAAEEPDLTAEKYDQQPLIVPDAGAMADVTGWLKKAGYKNVRGVHFGGSPRNRKAYANLAAEMWLEDAKAYFACIHCGHMFEAHFDEPSIVTEPVDCPGYVPGLQLPGDEMGEEADELLTQLITRQWFYTGKSKDQRALKSKDELRKETGKSPDHADAFCLSVVRPIEAHVY